MLCTAWELNPAVNLGKVSYYRYMSSAFNRFRLFQLNKYVYKSLKFEIFKIL